MDRIIKNPLSEENKFKKLKESCDDILILGQSGSGKGHLAKLLHEKSEQRANKPFIHLNCTSISQNIFESEMFGHVRGAFTGAIQNKEGYCSKVKDGDLFLDEIGDMPLELQAKLLVLINDRIYMPVGSNKTLKFEGRIIAATNKNLKKEISCGRFREDLFYRLNNFFLNVKMLCEQKEIIPELVNKFLIEENSDITFSEEALNYLSLQKWQGNIRQLKNVIKRIIRYSDKKKITKEDVIIYIEDEYILEYDDNIENKDLDILIKILHGKINGNLHVSIKLFLKNAFALYNENITATAKNIGVGRKTLERMLKKYKITKEL